MSHNSSALNAFIARKNEIDRALARLQKLSTEHFGISPEQINWGHVGDLAYYAEQLKLLSDCALKEGEFSEQGVSR